MKLTYRGIDYERPPCNLEVTEGEVTGKYRGQDWRYHYPRHMLELQPKANLKYRAVPYKTCPVSHRPVAKIELQRQQLQRNFRQVQSHTGINEATKVHLDNIRRNLERRLQVAKASGNQNLIQMLEKESKDLASL